MNLAKIRQKARVSRLSITIEEQKISNSKEVSIVNENLDINFDSDLLSVDCAFNAGSYSDIKIISPILPEPQKNRRDFDPVEVILAGRIEAGCISGDQAVSEEIVTVNNEAYVEFLCIRISDEFYGIDIMQIKEIIKPKAVTEVPRAPVFLQGVISLRGVILPVIDMLCRLGFNSEPDINNQRVVVVKSGSGFSGLLVDEVVKVVRLKKDSLESAPIFLEGLDRDFVSGIGRCDDRMFILLNLDFITDINLY